MAGIVLPSVGKLRGIVIPPRRSSFFSVHSHSRYSIEDALPSVQEMVTTVTSMGQPALALTDHGNMAGSVQLYTACKKAGIAAFPGSEFYFVFDREEHKAKKTKRRHLGILALNASGYEALVRLSSHSHKRENFHFKPLIDFKDLAQWKDNGWTDGLAITTGCYFGVLVQTLLTYGEEQAKAVLQTMARLVPNTYVELQAHNIDQNDEKAICDALFGLANECGLPIVLAQDAHYCHQHDRAVHDTLKRVVAYGPDPDDAVFPGDSFHLCDEKWIRDHHDPKHWDAAQHGFTDLLSKHKLAIKELDDYHYFIPQVVSDPDATLETLCRAALKVRNLDGNKPYEARLDEELGVLKQTRMSGYLLLCKEVIDWCIKNAVFYQVRGSAGGSLCCWLLKITAYNPIKFNCRFERFITPDRTKPPDVDIDVEDTRREELLDWLKGRFTVCQIGTYAQYGINEKDGKGSLIVAYKKVARARGETKEALSQINAVHDIPEPYRGELLALADRKVQKSYGVHAAGVVVTQSAEQFSRLIPTQLVASSETTITQFYDDDIEALGVVKLDVLGLHTLSLLRRCVELLGRSVEDGLDWIPLDDPRTFTAVRNGATSGVFQLEGYTARRGCREVKVRSLKDIILIMALYRPAVMKNGTTETYLKRREGRESPPQRHPVLMRHLAETFGLSVFQDQTIAILRDLGLAPEDLTAMLKAVKASQKSEITEARQKIASYRSMVEGLCSKQGMDTQDFLFLWSGIEGFAEYGFNRAHATGYGITAYWCAYLKAHYPLEFATALLQTAEGKDKESDYVSAVRQMGIRVGRPTVNVSGCSYSMDKKRNAVRRGLLSIKGIGLSAASEIAANAPYRSVQDLIDRTNPRRVTGGKSWATKRTLNGVLGKLFDAGVLAELGDDDGSAGSSPQISPAVLREPGEGDQECTDRGGGGPGGTPEADHRAQRECESASA